MVINILNDLHIGILANFYPEKVTFLKLLKAINLKGDLRLSQVLLYRLKSINSNSSSLNANDIVFVSQPRQARLFISLNEKRKAFFVQYWDVGFPTLGLFSYMAHFLRIFFVKSRILLTIFHQIEKFLLHRMGHFLKQRFRRVRSNQHGFRKHP